MFLYKETISFVNLTNSSLESLSLFYNK